MAITTTNGKLAVMELDLDWEPGLPLSPGALGQDDQQQLLWGFPEVLWGEAAVVLEPGSLGPVLIRRNAGRTVVRRVKSRAIWRSIASRKLSVGPILRGMDFPLITVVKAPNEEITYVLDFSVFEEIATDSGTLSLPTAPSVSGITVGTPTVSVSEIDGITAGQAVLLPLSGGTADTEYVVACRATITSSLGTSVREYRLNVQVR